MELFVFLDLDDTIFQTQRKCPADVAITPASFATDGSPISFFTPKQQRFFNLLSDKTHLIPTTARNYDAFSRTRVRDYDYAIINHGGIILNADGSCHQGWFSHIKKTLAGFLHPLQHLEKMLHSEAIKRNIGLKIRLIHDMGITFYCLIKQKDHNHHALTLLLTEVISPYLKKHHLDFYCHLNDNNLAILPRCLNKAPAVKFLQQQLNKQYADYLSFGIGDSVTDMPYMQLCDYFMTPKNSQIIREGFNQSHVMSTEV